ncbi:MAG TPA: cation:proton antiporter, partial [Terrimicrobiaceae bacterium]|nr:cation:proton antiporter [Terrimicrobiaceae bacterium]
WFLRDRLPLFSPQTGLLESMLFLGAAMAITAFPILARIIYERGLTGTSLGTLALAAGSIDDAAAWCILAVVLASFSHDASIAVLAIGGGALYAVVVATIIRPVLQKLARAVEQRGELDHGTLGFTLLLVMLGAWFTDAIGIYAVFGAFVLGVAVPAGFFAGQLRASLEKMTTCLLLPLFFVSSGLNTSFSLLGEASLLGATLLLLAVAIAGKGIACYLAALANGESHRDALSIGTLMNTRGLMELIILNIGLDRGVITPTLFTMMVIMAVVTTLMATPVFNFLNRHREAR